MKKDDQVVLQGLVDTKKEYLEYLYDTFTDSMIDCFQRLYKDCLQIKNGKTILVVFQQQLAKVPGWTSAKVSEEYGYVGKRANCSYIPALIKATLVVYVKTALLILS